MARAPLLLAAAAAALLRSTPLALADAAMADADADGYYLRTKFAEAVVGPLSEADFDSVRNDDDVASAWRIAGGQFYKVELKRRVTWERCFTCAACNHIFELVIVVVCFAMCAFSIALLRYDPKLRKQVDREAAEAGPATMYLIYGLFVLTFALVLTTVRKLLQRWRKQSSDVFVSEV